MRIGQNFTASTYLSGIPESPPDSNGTIGPQHFVQFINGNFSAWDKLTGANVTSMSDRVFWQNAGVSFSSRVLSSDPRLIYDRVAQRWFAAQIDFDASASNPVNNRFLLAVSSTADPTGAWNAVAFQADPARNFADFPTLGIDANGVYLGGNLFNGSGSFVGVLLTSIPKADLLLPTPTATNRTTTGLMSQSQRGFTLQSVINYSPASAAEKVLSVESDGTDFLPHSILKMFQVVGGGTTNPTFTSSINITVPPWNVPLDPPQPDGMMTLADGDSRISASVYQLGDNIYAVHGTQVSSNAAIRWYRISASNNSLLESGTISDPTLHLFYPSIAANENGYVVIGFNGCGTNTFVSSYAVVGQTTNGVTTFGNRILLKAGVANYEQVGSGGESRWGDYSATTVDPLIPNHFWTIQEFVSANNIWSTQITELQVAPPPSLQIALTGANVVLSWPTNHVGFALQSATNLLAGTFWAPVTNQVSVVGNQNTVTVSANGSLRFFRLQQ